MGISLPPVTQVTSVPTTPLTLHHRNRSLDSALQRIPEVDVTPSPECETTNNLLTDPHTCKASSSSSSTKAQRDELASLGSDDSGILCGSDSGSSDTNTTRESSVEHLSNQSNQSQESLNTELDVNDKNDVTNCVVVVVNDDDVKSTTLINIINSESECEKSLVTDIRININKINDDIDCCENPTKHSTGILRLLESKLFDVSMAMQYLFNSKDPGVQSYIANKMFTFDDLQVDFYLPQLVCMYIQMHDVAEVIHPYLIYR